LVASGNKGSEEPREWPLAGALQPHLQAIVLQDQADFRVRRARCPTIEKESLGKLIFIFFSPPIKASCLVFDFLLSESVKGDATLPQTSQKIYRRRFDRIS
jgi:hypothetical protein